MNSLRGRIAMAWKLAKMLAFTTFMCILKYKCWYEINDQYDHTKYKLPFIKPPPWNFYATISRNIRTTKYTAWNGPILKHLSNPPSDPDLLRNDNRGEEMPQPLWTTDQRQQKINFHLSSWFVGEINCRPWTYLPVRMWETTASGLIYNDLLLSSFSSPLIYPHPLSFLSTSSHLLSQSHLISYIFQFQIPGSPILNLLLTSLSSILLS